jgi:hypothetical protein
MRSLYILLCSSVCLLFPSIEAFSQSWIPVSRDSAGEAVSVNVLRDDATSYQIEVTVNGIYDQLITNERGNFHRLSLGLGGSLLESGEPALPLITRLIAIPTGASVSATIEEEHWSDVVIGKIFPSQIPPRESKELSTFRFNNEVYGRPFTPPVIRVGEEQKWRGIRNVGVYVCPFKYFPTDNRLSVLGKFVLRVDFTHASSDVTIDDEGEDSGLFDNTVYATLSPTHKDGFRSSSSSYDYLIIACNNPSVLNSEKLTEFRRWKALKGLKTNVIPLSTIGSNPSQNDIRQYIRGEVSNGVKYVLFIGDNSSIPTADVHGFCFTTSYLRGDYWYGCPTTAGAWEADVAVGRFSTNSDWYFGKMVDKSIRYESTRPLSDSILLVAHKESAGTYWGFQRYCEDIRNYPNYSEPRPFITAYGASETYGGNNATNAHVVNKINSGVPIVSYTGHGLPGFWGGVCGGDPYSGWNVSGESFTIAEAANMGSTSNAVFFSNSCNTANITQSGNMLEAFTRADYGAAAFVGSTSDILGFDEQNSTYGVYSFVWLMNGGEYNLGIITNKAHISNVSSYGGDPFSKDNALTYICGGDPALELWTATPQTFGDVTLTESNGSITITTGYNGSYEVNVVNESGDLLNKYSVASGNTCTFSKPSGNFYVGINKHNFIPHVIYYNTDAEFIQNVTFNFDGYYHHTPLDIGNGITTEVSYGPVVVEDGSKLIIENGTGGVYIDAGFSCKKGGIFEIK